MYRTLILSFIYIKATFVIICLTNFTGQGQGFSPDSTLLDSISSDDDSKVSFVMFDVGYTSNNRSARTSTQSTIPSIVADVAYFDHSGIWTGIFYSNYFEGIQNSYDIDFQIGFDKDFWDRFNFGIYYNWHNYTGDTTYQGIDYNHNLNLSLGIDSKILNVYVDGFSLHGTSNNYFLDINASIPLYFENIFFKDDYFMSQPTATFSFGTDHWLYDDKTYAQLVYWNALMEYRGYDIQDFAYQSTDFFIPITYGYKDISLMFSWIYSIPASEFKSLGWDNQMGFMISLNYTLSFNRKKQ